jgi:hypothetical protein
MVAPVGVMMMMMPFFRNQLHAVLATSWRAGTENKKNSTQGSEGNEC